MAITYKAPEYDNEKYRKGAIDTSAYDKQLEMFKQQAETNRATQLGEAQKQQQSALRQAYVTRLQNQKALNQNLAQSGIRGGMTETANLNLANQYGTARANANSTYANSVNSINQAVDQSVAEATMDIESKREQAIQDQANARWQADREDSLNEYNSVADYWYNYYTDYYSGVKKKKLDKLLKEAQANYDSATTDMDRLRYLQQIRGIQARRGVIANK